MPLVFRFVTSSFCSFSFLFFFRCHFMNNLIIIVIMILDGLNSASCRLWALCVVGQDELYNTITVTNTEEEEEEEDQ